MRGRTRRRRGKLPPDRRGVRLSHSECRKTRPMTERKKGRPARWGAREAHSIAFPAALRRKLMASAAAAGMNLTEYVVIHMAALEGYELPDANAGQDALPIGA
jgi:hypothetical protein